MSRTAFCTAICILVMSIGAPAAWPAAPSVYTQPTYESPVRGDPDDLLLIPGYGLAANDTVVYESVTDTTHPPVHPASVPTTSTAALGVADLVSAADAPYSLAVHLPAVMTANQSYVLWVRAPDGTWSVPIPINDARPLWITPDSAHSAAVLADLPRTFKVVGRNLQPGPGTAAATQVRLIGAATGTTYTLTAKNTANDSANTTAALERYVAEVSLPATLTVDQYSVQVSRDGTSWVPLLGTGRSAAQTFNVTNDPQAIPPSKTFRVSSYTDPVYGPCLPNDDKDDTYCIIKALKDALAANGGNVVFDSGTWTMREPGVYTPGLNFSNRMSVPCRAPTELCGVSWYGIIVPVNINLVGQGATGAGATTIERWNTWVESDHGNSPLIGFTLQGNNTVSGINFADKIDYTGGLVGAPELALGLSWGRSRLYGPTDPVVVSNITIADNLFTQPFIAIGSGGLPTDHVYIVSNTFGGAWDSAISIEDDPGDDTNLTNPSRPYDDRPFSFSDSVIAYNTFYPSSWQAAGGGGGTVATKLASTARLDFSHNVADGSQTATEYLAPPPVTGWRAAHFWSRGQNNDTTLISRNYMTCPGDKNGDGEAMVFDGDGHTLGGMPDIESVITSTAWTDSSVTPAVPGTTLTVQGSLVTTLSNSVDISANPTPFYRNYWIQVVQGRGKGQWRKVVSVATGSNSSGPTATFNVTPAFDVLPDVTSKVLLDHATWQSAIVDNFINQQFGTCTKNNAVRNGAGGTLSFYASTADSAIEGNQQLDTTGIELAHGYHPAHSSQCHSDRPCASVQTSNEVRNNVVQYAYNFDNTYGTLGGVQLAFGADSTLCDGTNCPAPPPPVLGFGMTVAGNAITHSDDLDLDGAHLPIGAIGVSPNYNTGPLDASGAARWQMGDATLIFHNSLKTIARTNLEHPLRVGVGIDVAQGTTLNPPISWRTTLYANSCTNVDVPFSDFGTGTVRYCPAGAGSNCECSGAANVDVGVSATSSAAGSTSTYTVRVTNNSTTTAASAVTLIVEPSAGGAINPGSYTVPAGSTCNSSVNVCNLGTLPANQTVTLSFTASPGSSGTTPITISVTHRDADPVAANDSVTL